MKTKNAASATKFKSQHFPELSSLSKQTAGAQLAPSHTSAPLPEPLMTTVAR